ncbi:MAG: hypothetical protein BWY93_00646 [Euryarchaeota archaeon ADurb.BinA087]|nr:MAG: hypothetical protein BWY93_00646 [Euryarchaeota archaeon ADurb.BinA087]
MRYFALWRCTRLVAALLLCITLSAPPCLALGYTYIDTGLEPVLSAQVVGDPKYYPGDTFTITVVLTNEDQDTSVQIAPLLAPDTYDPRTALGLVVSPWASDAPVSLKTPPVLAGDIRPGEKVPLTIQGTVDEESLPGTHSILLNLTYRYIYAIPMTGAEYTTIQPLYREMSLTIPVGITIKSEVRPVLLNVQQENLIPGTQGYLTGEVKNVGHATGSEVVFSVVPFDNVTFQVVEGSTYIGRFEPGQTAPVRVRIAVKDHTEAGGYPAVLQGTYRESDGSTRTTPAVPVGITVAKGAEFRVDSPGIVISPGGTALINVSYSNTGDSPASNAEARIIGSQVIVPAEDSAVLGFLGPGETRTAQFEISAKSAISGKQYPLDTEVKYRDGLGALMLSDRASLGVSVQSPEGTDAVTGNPALMIAIAGVGVIIAYAGWSVWRKHKNQ